VRPLDSDVALQISVVSIQGVVMLSEPSSNAVHVALVDLNFERADHLKRQFDEIPYVELRHFQNWAAFETHNNQDDPIRWRLVVIDWKAGTLQRQGHRLILTDWVRDLLRKAWLPNCHLVLLKYEQETNLQLPIAAPDVERVTYWPLDGSEVKKPQLTETLTQHIRRQRRLTVKLDGDLSFEQQLQAIAPRGDLERAKDYLATIAQRYMSNCGEICVRPLTQGFSGALVILAVLRPWSAESDANSPEALLRPARLDEDAQRQIVLKIATASDGRSVGRVQAYLHHITRLLKTDMQTSLSTPALTEDNKPVVSFNGLNVEASEYLGGEHGTFRSFGQIYCLHESNMPSPRDAIHKIFELLTQLLHKDGFQLRQAPLWMNGSAPYPETPAAPPYQLTAWWRAKILNALDALSRWAKQHEPKPLPDGRWTWEEVNRMIVSWITDGPNPGSIAATARDVVISAGHGDLNHNNVLWSDKLGRPFLIDFGTFHPEAHHLQDFAMFEAQLLFALMDCEDSSAHPAFDLTVTQLDVWLDRLPIWIPDDGRIKPFKPVTVGKSSRNKTQREGVQLAESLVLEVRTVARRSYENAASALSVTPQFDDEYCAALLYESIRMIAYDNSLSLFKRILAAHFAARLIRRLNGPTVAN